MAKFAGSLDSTVLLRLLINDIPDRHDAAVRLLEDGRRQFYVSDTAVIELIFALEHHYRMKRAAIMEAVTALIELPGIYTGAELITEALHIYVRRSAVSIADCYIYAAAGNRSAMPLWTFDKKFAGQLDDVQTVSNVEAYKSFEML